VDIHNSSLHLAPDKRCSRTADRNNIYFNNFRTILSSLSRQDVIFLGQLHKIKCSNLQKYYIKRVQGGMQLTPKLCSDGKRFFNVSMPFRRQQKTTFVCQLGINVNISRIYEIYTECQTRRPHQKNNRQRAI